jgi:hypothetical protein
MWSQPVWPVAVVTRIQGPWRSGKRVTGACAGSDATTAVLSDGPWRSSAARLTSNDSVCAQADVATTKAQATNNQRVRNMPVLFAKAPDCGVGEPQINIAPIVGDAHWPCNAQRHRR